MRVVTLRSIPCLRFLQSSTEPAFASMQNAGDKCAATSQNSNHQRDIDYIFKLIQWILGAIGIWPIAFSRIKHASKILNVIFSILISFTFVPCLLHMLFDEKDINKKLKLCGIISLFVIGSTKYSILLIRRSKIIRCIEYLKNDWWQVTFASDREQMLKYAVIGRTLMICSAGIMYTAGFIFHLILPFCSVHVVNNQTLRPLVYPTNKAFWQSQISPVYEIIYAVHCVCGYTLYSITVGTCGMAAMFVTHACGQIQLIVVRLKDVVEGKEFEMMSDVNQRLAAIVKRHMQVTRYVSVVEEMLQEVCLVELTSCLVTICLLEYFCILEWKEDDKIGLMTYFLTFISFCVNLYILCYTGDLLMQKSDQIGSMCCMINWYDIPPRSARNIILIIAMTKQPIKITAGGMIDLSLTSYGNVLKTSLAYLSFLRTLVI